MRRTLVHFSSESLAFDPARTYDNEGEHRSFNLKPRGLWLSDEAEDAHGWRKWCEGESFALDRLAYRTTFLCDVSNWVVIDTPSKLEKFGKQFQKPVPFLTNNSNIPDQWNSIVDWDSVKKEFAGILISPYQYSMRFDVVWYYSWDCASACVWDLKTVEPLWTNQTESVNLVGDGDTSNSV